MPCSVYLQGDLIKKRRGNIISSFTKGETFASLMTTKCPWGQSSNVVPLLAPSKNGLSFPFSLARREYFWTLNLKESLLICFENCQGIPCSHRQSRNRMMNTFIRVNITPICNSLQDKSIFVHFKKAFPLTSLGHSFERRAYWFVLKATRVFPIPAQAD